MRTIACILLLAGLSSACALRTARHPEGKAYPLYHFDLGPDTIDVSAYPPERQEQYRLFARRCSSCHTLARSINVVTIGRDEWAYYVMRMRLRGSKTKGVTYTREEGLQIVDFLAYDAQIRKAARLKEFEAEDRARRKKFFHMREKWRKRMQRSEPR